MTQIKNKYIRSHKIALDPTEEQKRYLYEASNASRFVWNWALRRWKEEYSLYTEYRCGSKPSAELLDAELNTKIKKQHTWLNEISAITLQHVIMDNLKKSFQNFWRELKKGNKKAGYPKFKHKNSSKSFLAGKSTNRKPNFVVSGKTIRIPHPNVNGKRHQFIIKMREELRFKGDPILATISLSGERWFVSIAVEMEKDSINSREFKEVGIDLGSNTIAVLSDGTTFENPKALKNNLKKLRRLNKSHSRKKNGSQNKIKSRLKLSKLHAKITNIRKESSHTMTTSIVKKYSHIGIEDLNVKGMMANRKLARTISDIGLYEIRRQLEYKAELSGTKIEIASRWYPSTQLCSKCGEKNATLTLKDRKWKCSNCRAYHDRDLNAAINLSPTRLNPQLAATYAVSACGEESSDDERNFVVKLSSKPLFNAEKKQESLISLLENNGLEVSAHSYLTNVR